MADRLFKNVSVARSGVQDYLVNEPSFSAFNLGPAPEWVDGKSVVTVYRPATVIASAKDLFAKQPLIKTHEPGMIGPDNFRDHAMGWTGDTADIEWADDEVIVRLPLTIMDSEAIADYESGIREVSPGYGGSFHWQQGKSSKGEDYDIVMDKVEWVNHLAMVPRGRGGSAAAILDHKGDTNMKKGPKTGLLHFVKRSLGLITDSEPVKFREAVNSLVKDRAVLDDDAIGQKIEAIKAAVASLPESEEKSALVRMIDDLGLVKGQPDDVANKAGEVVSDMYEGLDKKAMAEVPVKDVATEAPDPTAAGGGAAPLEAGQAPGSTAPIAPENPIPGKQPAAAAKPVVDLNAVAQKSAETWQPEEVHAVMNALIKLLPQEAAEPEHADIAPDLEAGAQAGEAAEAEQSAEDAAVPAEPTMAEVRDGEDDKEKDKDKPKVIGDSMAYFASARSNKVKPMGTVAALIHNKK